MRLVDVSEWSHLLIRQYVREGGIYVDATAGNGHDTLFLSQMAGQNGRVYAFDVQTEALIKTKLRLEQNNSINNVVLIESGHENMETYIHSQVDAVMFNLGYLPGGDKEKATRPETTLCAVKAALRLLRPGGMLTVCIYCGHDSGQEKALLVSFLQALDSQLFEVLSISPENRKQPPILAAVYKKVEC